MITPARSSPKKRDSESGLDYFLARYYSSNQGRFTSPDPIFFQKAMTIDPQRFNLYAYVRNTPTIFADPKGEEIELVGNEEERKKALALLQRSLGASGGYLAEKVVKKDGSTRYFVTILTGGIDGKSPGPAPRFETINPLASVVGRIIRDSAVAQLSVVKQGTVVEGLLGEKGRIGSLATGLSPAATSATSDGARVWGSRS